MAPWVIPAIITALGTGLSMKAQADALRRQREQALAESMRQMRFGEQRSASVLENLNQYRPENRMQAQEQVAQAIESRINPVLQESVQESLLAKGATGRVSPEYIKAKGRQVKMAGDRANRLAALLAKYRAPGDMRMNEAFRNAAYTTGETLLNSAAADSARTSDAIIRGIRPNPMMTFLGSAMTSYGLGQLGSAFKGGGATGGK